MDDLEREKQRLILVERKNKKKGAMQQVLLLRILKGNYVIKNVYIFFNKGYRERLRKIQDVRVRNDFSRRGGDDRGEEPSPPKATAANAKAGEGTVSNCLRFTTIFEKSSVRMICISIQ